MVKSVATQFGDGADTIPTRSAVVANGGLRPYPELTDSRVWWLGEVPAHWVVERLKWSLANVVEQVAEVPRVGTVVALALENVESWTGRVVLADSGVSFDSQLKGFQAGDVLFGKLRPYLAKVARLANAGLCVGEFLVLRPRHVNVMGAYYELLLRSKPIIEAVAASTYGAKMPRSDWLFVGGMPVVRPPLAEQAAIVRFLDHAARRIRRYIRAKQKLIALLEEQKQAVIQEAVTGRIDVRSGQPYAGHKPSGVKSLGEVPKDWRLVRLKDVARVQTGVTLGKDYRGTRTIARPYLRVANVQDGRLDLAHVKTIDVPVKDVNGATLADGDVLMTEGGDIDKLGRGCVWRCEIAGCLHQNHVFAVRCRREELQPEFLVGLMISRHGRRYFQLTAKQTTNLASTNSTTLRAFPVLLPPLQEQLSILQTVAEKTTVLDDAVGRLRRETELVHEYWTRLIADVVTGKLDVREAAARLPDLDPLAAPEDLDDGLNRDAGSEGTACAEEVGPLADVSDGGRSEGAVAEPMIREG